MDNIYIEGRLVFFLILVNSLSVVPKTAVLDF